MRACCFKLRERKLKKSTLSVNVSEQNFDINEVITAIPLKPCKHVQFNYNCNKQPFIAKTPIQKAPHFQILYAYKHMNKNFSLTENQGVFKEFFENCKFQEHFKRP